MHPGRPSLETKRRWTPLPSKPLFISEITTKAPIISCANQRPPSIKMVGTLLQRHSTSKNRFFKARTKTIMLYHNSPQITAPLGSMTMRASMAVLALLRRIASRSTRICFALTLNLHRRAGTTSQCNSTSRWQIQIKFKIIRIYWKTKIAAKMSG